MQKQFWNQMYTIKYNICYMELCLKRYRTLDQIVKIVSAALSALALGVWMYWTNTAFWCGVVIVAFQIGSIIYDALPNKDRINILSILIRRANLLLTETEAKWRIIFYEGNVSDEAINEYITDIQNKWNNIDSDMSTNEILPDDKKIKEKSQNIATKYFNSYGC